jgi:hypothetical protein
MTEYLEALKIIADLGGTVVIAIAMIICAYKLCGRAAQGFCQAAKGFVEALEKIALAVDNQAKSMADMKPAIDRMVAKDNMEHREILLGMQVVGEELKSLTCEIRDLREERSK